MSRTIRILVCEYITGGGLRGEPLPPSLAREGELMLGALLRDLAAIPGVMPGAALDPRLAHLRLPGEAMLPAPDESTWEHWTRCIDRVNAVWPIAPETDGCLERLSRLVLRRGRVLLGCRPAAVALAASKRATAEHLAARGIAVVPTYRPGEAPLDRHPVWVLKPDDGVGCTGVRCYADRSSLLEALARPENADCVLQPYVEGEPGSLSMICRDGDAWLLAGNRQQISHEGGAFRLDGVRVNALARRHAELAPLADRVAEALPDLWGYVGVDFVLAADGPRVLEINPRLTTAYAGLSAALGRNPAALVLDLWLRHSSVTTGRDWGETAEVHVGIA